MPKRKRQKKDKYSEVVEESFTVKEKHGGGLIKIEAWEDSNGNVVKYSLAYINQRLCFKDNGRVVGYDNSHHYHHKHYFGDIIPIDDFVSYEEIVNRFENDIKEFINGYQC